MRFNYLNLACHRLSLEQTGTTEKLSYLTNTCNVLCNIRHCHYQSSNDPGQVIDGCLSRLSYTMAHWRRDWHTQIFSMTSVQLTTKYVELKWLKKSIRNQTGHLLRATVSNSYRWKCQALKTVSGLYHSIELIEFYFGLPLV
jgi:hypothetical protein